MQLAVVGRVGLEYRVTETMSRNGRVYVFHTFDDLSARYPDRGLLFECGPDCPR